MAPRHGHFIYDAAGRLIAESDATGAVQREYVWLGLTPVAVIEASGLYYLHADHLGRPQYATDTAGAVFWDGGAATPFGEGVSTAGAVSQQLMFPGQYADDETGLSDNWHRTYDPTLGRYLQADPIGLAGGINRYAYVGGNPLRWIDPLGLDPPGSSFPVPEFYPSSGPDFPFGMYRHEVDRLDPANQATSFVPGVDELAEIWGSVESIQRGAPIFPMSPYDNVPDEVTGACLPDRFGPYMRMVVPTPGISNAGKRRLIIGRDGKIFYTNTHYQHFIPVVTADD